MESEDTEEKSSEEDPYNVDTEVTMTSGMSINNVEFDNCIVVNGNGGAISMGVHSTKAQISMSSTTFKKCAAYSGTIPTNTDTSMFVRMN